MESRRTLYPFYNSSHTHKQLCGGVQMVEGVSEQLHTVQILSDGSFVYWLYALKSTETIPHPLSSEKLKQHPVYVQALKMEVCYCVCVCA